MISILPTRQYRLWLSIGVWLLCAVFAFFVGALTLEVFSVLAVGKLVILVAALTWVYRQLTRIGEIHITATELSVLQPWYSVRIPFAQVEHVQQRAQTLVRMQAGVQTRVHRVILDVRLSTGAVKPVVVSVLSAEDAQWIEQLLHIASTQNQSALSAHLAVRASAPRSHWSYILFALSFLVVSALVGVVALL